MQQRHYKSYVSLLSRDCMRKLVNKRSEILEDRRNAERDPLI